MMTDCGSSYKSSSGNSKPSASEERSHIRDPEIDINFITTHFSSPTTLSEITSQIKEDSSIQKFLLILEKGSKEWGMYETLDGLFNQVAAIVSGDEPMLFHPSYAKRPLGESRQEDRSLAPDFSILPPKQKFTTIDKHETLRIPWSTLESFVEVKTKKRSDHPQGIDYIETLLQYRPDKVFALGMSCNEHTYQFYYADACTQKSSPTFSWKGDLSEFVQFVHTLHLNYAEDVGRDTSYILHDVKWSDLNASARWRISFHGRTNEVQRMFARKGTGRRTWLGIGYEINDSSTVTNNFEKDKIRIVKDMWRDASRRFKESEILDQIHMDGYIAGVVRHIYAGPVGVLTVEEPKKELRIKERVNMASTGLRLSACESVLDFLKVMYDLVETHEQLLVKRDVLHRDISWNNVLCKPEHFTGDAKVIDHPTIGKILRKEGRERQPLCLLTDFDNASSMKEMKVSGATERTGTPMFMACELSHGLGVYKWLKNVPAITLEQFLLEDDVLEAYLEVYSEERYAKYQGWLAGVLSGGEEPPRSPSPSALSHQPSHDMESVYWIIVWFIVKSWPTGTKLDVGILETLPNEHEQLRHTMLRRGLNLTSSVALLHYSADQWEVSLHPIYKPLIGMLVNMSQYLCMPWSQFSKPLPWHSHEAFKRLLLKEIVRMTNENEPIPIQGPRHSRSKGSASNSPSIMKGSQAPSQVPTSSHVSNTSGPQSSVGSIKRKKSAPAESECSHKRLRRTVEENPDPLAKIIENLASDALWFL